MKPEEVIAAAKELSNKANELAKQLKAMADATSDPVFKEVIIISIILLILLRSYSYYLFVITIPRNCSLLPRLFAMEASKSRSYPQSAPQEETPINPTA